MATDTPLTRTVEKANPEDLYDRITQALEAYAAELVDILDHVSDNEEANSYGRRSLDISELIDEWELHRQRTGL